MNYIILQKSVSKTRMQEIIDEFVPFCMDYLNLHHVPDIKLVGSEEAKKLKAFGQHTGKDILVDIENRQPMDVLRTLAHEFVHQKQDLKGKEGSAPYRGNEKENQANAEAGIMLRNFAKKHPDYFILDAVA